jgi:hypothetical protein
MQWLQKLAVHTCLEGGCEAGVLNSLYCLNYLVMHCIEELAENISIIMKRLLKCLIKCLLKNFPQSGWQWQVANCVNLGSVGSRC